MRHRIDTPPAVRAGLVLSSIGVGLLLVEGGLRRFAPRPDYGGRHFRVVPDPHTGFRLQPGLPGATNSAGFRGPEFEARKGAGVRRVLVVGDSVTAGAGVRESDAYPRVLEALLAQGAAAPRFQVLNAGVGAWEPVQYRRFLETRGLALEPDLVVVGFFLGNDVSRLDEAGVGNMTAQGGWRVLNRREFEGLPWWARTRRRLNAELYTRLQLWRRLSDFRLGARAEPAGFSPDYLELQRQRAFIYLKRPEDEAGATAAWDNTFEELARISALCRARGVPLLVALLPDETQVEPRLWAALALPRERYDPREPQRRLLSFCRARGIDCLDVSPAFGGEAGRGSFLLNDTHPSPAGHRLIAQAVAQRVRASSLMGAGR